VTDSDERQQNGLGEVQACDCGGVNLVLGPVTLHVEADEVDALLDLACAAKEMTVAAQRRRKSKRRKSGKPKVVGTLH
jgi:hypothetical protein